MTVDQVRVLLREGESEQAEFKKTEGKPQLLAQIIAGFANSRGGVLLIGVDEKAGVVGIRDPARVEAAVRDAASKLVDPRLAVATEQIVIEGQTVVSVTVPRGESPPYLADGLAVARVGARLLRLSGDDLMKLLGRSADPTDAQIQRLADLVAAQGAELARMRKALSLPRQIALVVLGTILGAGVTLLIGLLH